MPRRRALTEAQLADLFALPTAEPDLIRHWTLGAADLAVARDRLDDVNLARGRESPLAFVDVPNEIASIVSGAPADVSAAAQFDKVTQNVDYLLADALAQKHGKLGGGEPCDELLLVAEVDGDLHVRTLVFDRVNLVGDKRS